MMKKTRNCYLVI